MFFAHVQIPNGFEMKRRYAETIRTIYEGQLGCEFRWLKASALTEDVRKAREDVTWTDILYEGGDTVAMMELWQQTGFDILLKEAWEAGKLLCGVSALCSAKLLEGREIL